MSNQITDLTEAVKINTASISNLSNSAETQIAIIRDLMAICKALEHRISQLEKLSNYRP